MGRCGALRQARTIRAEFRAVMSTRPILHAAAEAIVPAARDLDAEGWRAFDTVVERELEDRPRRVRRRFHTFLRLLDLLPIARYALPFRLLGVKQRLEVLSSLHDSQVDLMREGVIGLRTIVFMGYRGHIEETEEARDPPKRRREER